MIFFGGEVGQRDGRTALVHQRTEVLDHGNVGVRRGGDGSQVTLSAGFEQRLGDFRTIGQGVNKNINLTEVFFDALRDFADGPLFVTGVTLVRLDVLRDVIHVVEDGIHRVNLGERHHGAIAQLTRLVELAAFVGRLEDVQRRDPGTQDDLRAGLGERLGDRPTEAVVVRDTRDERLLTRQINVQPRAHARRASRRANGPDVLSSHARARDG